MLDLGISQMTHVQTKLGTPVTFSGLDPYAISPTAPTLNGAVPTPGAVVSDIDPGDLTADLEATRDAIDARVQFQIENDRANRIIALANQGIVAGMEAYDFDLFAFDKQSTDARLQTWLAAQKEQTRAIEAKATIASFANTAQAQMFQPGRHDPRLRQQHADPRRMKSRSISPGSSTRCAKPSATKSCWNGRRT